MAVYVKSSRRGAAAVQAAQSLATFTIGNGRLLLFQESETQVAGCGAGKANCARG